MARAKKSSDMQERIIADLLDSSRCLQGLALRSADIERAAILMVRCLHHGGMIVSCGNGGSAADAQHLASELAGRFEMDRPCLPAIAITTNSSIITAVANDSDYIRVFSRQIAGLMKKDDVLVAISTSGNSPNILEAARAAKRIGASVIGCTGDSGGKLRRLCDVCLRVPHTRTSRIQEGHLAILHALCGVVENKLFFGRKKSKAPYG